MQYYYCVVLRGWIAVELKQSTVATFDYDSKTEIDTYDMSLLWVSLAVCPCVQFERREIIDLCNYR